MHAMDFIPPQFRLVQPPRPQPKPMSDDEWFWKQDRAERELMTYPPEDE